ncbi:putative RNA 2'-phosphotransferase [Pseudomonas savastanoi pv. retacarpa]|nr:putative RNA 2'-phosphotransferase [Pseudomonas savastanoi pv. retacarpa]
MKKCTSLNKKQRDEISKLLSYLLRHAPESMGLTLDRDGWSDVDDLIRKANAHGHAFDRQALNEVVETNEKKRFTLSEDDQRIRAAQGHSTVQVQVQHAGYALSWHRKSLHDLHRDTGADRRQSASCSSD